MTDSTADSPRYRLAHFSSIEGVACPCGEARRAFTEDADQIASMHVVEIKADSQTHYHKHQTEIYYILEGEGKIELDGESFDVFPGTSILIKPGCRHRAVGKIKLLNVCVPSFNVEDEWFD